MGSMPNKWAGLAAALLAGAILGGAGYFVGSFAGDKLANGFTFDWYVHPALPGYAPFDVIKVAALTSAIAAFVGISLVLAPTSFIVRKRMARVGHTPPRLRDPISLDIHALKLVAGLGVAVSLVALLGGYALVADASPLSQGPGDVAPEGYVAAIAAAAAIGAGLPAAAGVYSTFRGFVTGRLVQRSDRNIIARISIFGVRNSATTVAIIAAFTLVMGYYATSVTTNVDVADVLPRGDPNTVAAHNLTDKFKSSFTQQVTFQFHVIDEKDEGQLATYDRDNRTRTPLRVTERDESNISDEVYVRAIAEAVAYVLDEEPFAGSVGAPDLFKLVNWTIAGGKNTTDASFSLPPTDQEGELRYRSVEEGVFAVGSVYAAVDALTSPNWTQTAVLITVSPKDDVSAKVIGQRALEVRDQYVRDVAAGKTDYTVFGPENPPLFSVDLPLANAHASELTAHDFKTLMPFIAIFIGITLFIAFRNAASVIVTFSSLAIAVIWTFGAMGLLKIPLNTINLAVVPLIMGVGIDYGIHMMNEYQEFRAKGLTQEQAWIKAGGGSAFALFVGALTTVAGLVVMIASPSLIVAQLGILGNVALVACYILAILFVPAFTTLLGGRRKAKAQEYKPSTLMPAFATGISRGRIAVALVMVLLLGAAAASAAGVRREAFGDPPRNWLPGDPLREEHSRAIEGFYETGNDEVKANVLIIEGDITDPAVHAYINGLTGTLRSHTIKGWTDPNTNITHKANESRIIADTLKDLPFLMNTWLTVKDGLPGTAQFLGAPALRDLFNRTGQPDPTGKSQPYPDTKEEMRATLDDVFESPLYQLGNLFVDAPDYEMTVIVFSVKAATYPDAEAVWNEVRSAIKENEHLKPEGVQTNFFGNTAINYLFVAKQVPWLNAMNIVANVLIVLIVFTFTRRIGPTIAVGLVSSMTSLFWFGLLPVLDIGLAISLTLPLIFISAMGSDYALHLAMRASHSKNTRETFESVGKGVLFSFVTTFGAFLIFTQVSDLAGRRSIIATCLAIAVVFAVSLITVPLVYPVKKHQRGTAGGDRNVPIVESRSLEVPAPAGSTPLPSKSH